MIGIKQLLAMARKWQELVAKKQRRISLPRSGQSLALALGSSVAKQGHFVAYSVDKKRFEFPLEHLRSNIFVQLFRMSEIEFGLPTHGPITLPCVSLFLEYVVSFVEAERRVGEDLQKALLLTSMSFCHSSSMLSHCDDFGQRHNSILILGF